MSSQVGMGEELVVFFGLTSVQFIYGVYSIFVSRILAWGLDPLFIVISTSLINFALLAPFAVAFEREKWPAKLSPGLMLQLVLIALGGVTAFQALMALGIQKTSPTIASAMPNLSPGLIFIIAACLSCRVTFSSQTVTARDGVLRPAAFAAFRPRFERVDIRCAYSKAKIVGTVMCLTGAIAMSFLQNPPAAPAPKLSFFLRGTASPATADDDWILGCIYLLSAVFILSCSMVQQAATMEEFPAPVSLCAITSLIGAVLTGAVQLVAEKKLDVGSPVVSTGTIVWVTLLGGVGTSVCIWFQTWCIRKRGPVLVSMFSPICTVCTAILSAFTLGQLLNMGSLAGMVVMFAGLYLVLWAKNKEAFLLPDEGGVNQVDDIEKPLHPAS